MFVYPALDDDFDRVDPLERNVPLLPAVAPSSDTPSPPSASSSNSRWICFCFCIAIKNVTSLRFKHSPNALLLILETVVGISTLVRLGCL